MSDGRRVVPLFLMATIMMLLALCLPSAWGQTFYGSISGAVVDASGAAIPDVAVTLTNTATGDKRTMQSDASGSYTFVNLVPGNYKMEAEKAGFKQFVRDQVVVEVQNSSRIDIPMQVGAVTQTVEVSAQTPLLQPQTSDLGQVVESRTVNELPLNGRNPIALVELSPGVVPQGPPSAGNSSLGNPVGANPFGAGDFQIGGGQAGQNAILLDGVPTNGSYLNVVTVIPTQDALQEFKIQTNNMGPEFGRFAGGVINFTTKSGSNDWHGAAYEYLRNKVLDANDFFLNEHGVPIGPWTQNQFGGNIGGKLIRDKLFVFGSYEGYRRRSSSAFTSTVPTDAMKAGDFSGLSPIYDPTTSTDCTSGGGTCRTQVGLEPGGSGTANVLAPSQINPTSAAFLSYFPEPTGPGTPTTLGPVNNFTDSYSTGGNTSELIERTDYDVSQKQRIFGRFTYYNLLNLPDSPFSDICTDRCTETVHAKQFAVGDTFSFNPTTILDLHLGYTRYVYVRTPLTSGFDMSKLGSAWAGYQFASAPLPVVCISQNPGDDQWGGGWCSAGTGSEIGAHDDTWSLTPSLTKIMGRHTIKAGYEGRLLRNNYYQTNQPSGNFSFDDHMTSANPLTPLTPTTAGSGFASFLLGYGDGGSVVTPSFMAPQMWYNAWYVGDTFQATPKLTLNLGARYELQGNWTERFNRLLDFQGNLTSPLAGMTNPNGLVIPSTLKGGFALVDTPASPGRTDENMPLTDINPRIGIAYRLGDNTVIRAGYGIFFLPNDVRWNDAPHNLFNNTYSQNWISSNVTTQNTTPLNTFSNPFPTGIVQPFGRNAALINVDGNGPSAPVLNNPEGYAQQWNFDIQHDFHDGTLIDVAYAGAKGTHLPMHSQDLDQLSDSLLPTSSASASALTAQVPNPYYGIVQGAGSLNSATTQAAQLLLPYPQYSDISSAEPDDRDSEYESLQMKVQKRLHAGGTLLASYTISKLISDTNNEINWLGDAAPSWGDIDAYNLHNERSLDGFDVPQRFVGGYVLDLPVGHGKRYGNSLSPVANKLVSGWGIDGIITLQSGFPLNIGGVSDTLCSSGVANLGGCRADRTGTPSLTSGSLNDRLNDWFTTSNFTSTGPGDWSRGNDSRTEPNLRQDAEKGMDFAAFKNTKFGPDERLGLEFRAEFFNIFNHPQFSAPNESVTSPTFGQVTSQYNLPRIIQFGLKLTF